MLCIPKAPRPPDKKENNAIAHLYKTPCTKTQKKLGRGEEETETKTWSSIKLWLLLKIIS